MCGYISITPRLTGNKNLSKANHKVLISCYSISLKASQFVKLFEIAIWTV